MSRTPLAGALVLGAGLIACAPADDAAIAGAPADETTAAAARPRMFAGDVPTGGATAEDAARAFLAGHAARLGVDAGDLAVIGTRRGLAGTYVRFQQVAAGVPVFGRQVVVAVSADRRAVRAVNLGRCGPIALPLVALDRGPRAAIDAALAHTGAIALEAPPTAERGLEVMPHPRLAYRVTVATRAATWEVSVDAATGAILSVRDRRAYADGTGLVFDMTPVASTGDPTLADGDDLATPALDLARFAVTLPRLDGTGVLRGAWVDVTPLDAAARATEPGLAFAYDRGDDRFEEVMAYYHLDRAQARLQALGFVDVVHRAQVARVNATAADNSYFDPATKELRFGSGGVDDAEDADIILHEYGHAIQDDVVPGWGGGDERAMGEGFGDYLAASFSESLPAAAGHAQPFGQLPCVGEWDATSYATGTPRCLRRTDGAGHAPEDTIGQSHADGELWSAGLWRARAAVGADVMDSLVIEAHFLLTNDESFADAAAALLIADEMVFGGAHEEAVRRALYHHGLLRAPRPAAAYPTTIAVDDVILEHPRDANGLYPHDLDDVQTYSRPGSLALRVHFATVDLVVAGDCAGASCDNLYVTDGAGDLYQILTEAENGPRLSVQVPGDTIALRLVTDRAGQGAGYRVDRVEALGPPPVDAAPPIDARVLDAAPDARPPVTTDDDGGCCSAGASPASAPLALLAGVLLRRRRRIT